MLSCYKHESEWRTGTPPKLIIDLREYVCLRTWDPNGAHELDYMSIYI